MFDFSSLDMTCLAAFGRSVSHTRPGVTPVVTVITAIVSPGRTLENFAPGSGVNAVAFLHVADLPSAPAEKDTITVGSKVYTVWQVELDAIGGAHLGLR